MFFDGSSTGRQTPAPPGDSNGGHITGLSRGRDPQLLQNNRGQGVSKLTSNLAKVTHSVWQPLTAQRYLDFKQIALLSRMKIRPD